VIILASAPRVALLVPEARRNLSRAVRIALVEPDLVRLCAEGPSDDILSAIAVRASRSRRSAERMAEEALWDLVKGDPEPEDKLPFDFLVAIADRNGNTAAAIRDYWPDEATRPNESTIYARLNKVHPGLALSLKHGRETLDKYMEIGCYPAIRRHDLLIIDETDIPVDALGPNGQRIDNLGLISVIDHATKLVLNAQVTIGAANELIASAMLARVWAGGTWDGHEYGGSSQAISLDNAFIFAKSEHFARAMGVGGIAPKFARPYVPADKAVLERWHRTLKDMGLSAVPGNTREPQMHVWVENGELREDGKPKKVRMLRALHNPIDDAQLPSVALVAQAIYAAIDDYNFNHVHSALGGSAMESYISDLTPCRPVGLAALWDFALPVGIKHAYKVERRGVWIDYERYSVDGQVAPDEYVSIRQLPGIDPRFLIGTPDGRYIGEVTRADDQTEAEREQRLTRNREKAALLSSITKISRQNTLERVSGTPGTAAYLSDTNAKKLQARDDAPLADLGAAATVPARKPVPHTAAPALSLLEKE